MCCLWEHLQIVDNVDENCNSIQYYSIPLCCMMWLVEKNPPAYFFSCYWCLVIVQGILYNILHCQPWLQWDQTLSRNVAKNCASYVRRWNWSQKWCHQWQQWQIINFSSKSQNISHIELSFPIFDCSSTPPTLPTKNWSSLATGLQIEVLAAILPRYVCKWESNWSLLHLITLTT